MARHEHRGTNGRYSKKEASAEERNADHGHARMEGAANQEASSGRYEEGRWKEDLDADKESGYDDWTDDFGDSSNAQHNYQQKGSRPVYSGTFAPHTAAKFKPYSAEYAPDHDDRAKNGRNADAGITDHEKYLLGGH